MSVESSRSLPSLRIEDCVDGEKKDSFLALKERRDELQKALNEKLAELRSLCLREGEITGELPPETPLGPREPVPQIRKRVRTECQQMPSRASSRSLSHSPSISSNASTFSHSSNTSNASYSSSIPQKKVWMETSVDSPPVVRRKKVPLTENRQTQLQIQVPRELDEVDSSSRTVKSEPKTEPVVRVCSPVSHVKPQISPSVPHIVPQIVPQQSIVKLQPQTQSPQSLRDLNVDDTPLREVRRNTSTPRPVSIPLSPILPKPGAGVEVNVLSVGHFQPYWEETKPYELSDFYKYSTKYRRKENADNVDSKETSRRVVETITITSPSSTTKQVVASPPPIETKPSAISNLTNLSNQANNSALNCSLNESFLVKSAVAADFHEEMYDWYETKVKKATLV